MKRVIDISEVLGMVTTPQGARELCVTADAQYEEDTAQLLVRTEAFLRNQDLVAPERHFGAAWLPKGESLRESVGAEEAGDLAREIFQRWVRRVRQAAPAIHLT